MYQEYDNQTLEPIHSMVIESEECAEADMLDMDEVSPAHCIYYLQ